jgi:(1->4)-alpha-D-glucan 1-alpha-D-glucosylmutase
MTPWRATYRLQLREGMTFARAAGLLPALEDLGISHLYLSPIFTAAAGSTHGYDVTDPTAIEPALGGREGFERLAAAARDHGIGLLLDIVPNHTAFALDNPWLRDVLRHGERSRWARHFDIDWSKGRLVLPFLPDPFEAMLEAGAIRAADGEDGPELVAGDLAVPLTPHPLSEEERAGEAEAIRALHARQPWRLAHWELERDGITHRRFFNVTGLIGMRVEEEQVFEDTHALILDLVEKGLVQGLRVDHVDGLADPGAYLARLAQRAPGCPVWVEKILVGDEALPPWPVEGTTGYEAGAAIARALTDADGLARLDALWRDATGEDRPWEAVLAEAKGQVIRQVLSAELAQLKDLALAAAAASGEVEAGEEALREAVLALLLEIPRYRTYLEAPEGPRRAEDVGLLDAAADRAAEGLVSDRALRWLARAMAGGETEAARALAVRFQQVSGALMAKSQEDTAFYRFTRCLAHCEVGAEPSDCAWTPARLAEWAAARGGRDLVLTSSHDTKRAEDARMRLVAMTHRPEAFAALWGAAQDLPGAAEVTPAQRWYLVQSWLAIHEDGREDIGDRLAAHVEKALREAKEVTTWTHPREEAEEPAQAFARALAAAWREPPAAARPLIERGDQLSLAQLALKAMLPGIPDFYQGAEGALHHLTDPDNRLAVDFEALAAPPEGGLAAAKLALTRALLRLRAEAPGLFDAPLRVEEAPGGWRLSREGPEGRLALTLAWEGGGAAGSLWPPEGEGPVALDWRPA